MRTHPDRITGDGCGVAMIALRSNTIPKTAAAQEPGSLSFGAATTSAKEIKAPAPSKTVWKRNFIVLKSTSESMREIPCQVRRSHTHIDDGFEALVRCVARRQRRKNCCGLDSEERILSGMRLNVLAHSN